MLRRLSRVLRRLLFVLGLVVGLLLIVNMRVYLRASSPWPGDQTVIIIVGGVVQVYFFWDATGVPLLPETVEVASYEGGALSVFTMFLYFPSYRAIPDPRAVAHALTLPLWLLAFLCLAWPVTSFIIARRRRRGRGFEVETKAGGSTPLPPDPDGGHQRMSSHTE